MAFSYAAAASQPPTPKPPKSKPREHIILDPRKDYSDCAICCNKLFLPVTLNVFQQDPNDFNHRHNPNGKLDYKKCPAIVCNPCCLSCIRDYITFQEGPEIKCPFRCCEGYKYFKPTYLNYGTLPRLPKDYAEYTFWHQQFTLGKLNQKCNRCNHDCETFDETLNHLRKDCPKRKLPCKLCKTLISFDEIDTHNLTCIFKNFTYL